MLSLHSAIFHLALVTCTIAVQILTPTSSEGWTSSGPNEITWKNQTGDPTTFSMQLAQNNVSLFTPSLALAANGTFLTDVSMDLLLIIFVPSCIRGNPKLPMGEGFTINFLQESADGSEKVIATSDTFSIVYAPVTQCLVQDVTSSAASPGGANTSVPVAGSLSTSSKISHTSAIIGGTIGGILGLLLVGGVVLWTWKGRRERRQKTMEFGMKLGMRGGGVVGGQGNKGDAVSVIGVL